MPLFTQEDNENLHNEVMAFRGGRKQRIPEELVDIDFKVLQDAVKCMRLPDVVPPVEDAELPMKVDSKMAFNHLSDDCREVIYPAVCYSQTVGDFIIRKAVDDNDDTFPYRLETFFRGIYAEYYNNGWRGDDLFDAMLNEIEKLIPKRKAKRAASAILVHLFEKCVVFEKDPAYEATAEAAQ